MEVGGSLTGGRARGLKGSELVKRVNLMIETLGTLTEDSSRIHSTHIVVPLPETDIATIYKNDILRARDIERFL